MFHTERDSAVFFAEMLLLLATGVGIVYAVGVMIALVFKGIRSLRALYISLVLSALASVPLVLALFLQWPYLPGEWNRNPAIGVLSLIDALLLSFVWAAPIIQYRLIRSSPVSNQQMDR